MNPVLQPFHLLAVIFAGWANRHQQRVIEYLLEENRAFNEFTPTCRGRQIWRAK